MKRIKLYLLMFALSLLALGCANEDVDTSDVSSSQMAIDLAQTTGQLASGTRFMVSGSTLDSSRGMRPDHRGPGAAHHGFGHDGLSLLPLTDELRAFVDAESASDVRGMRIFTTGGATVTHYNTSGDVVTLPSPERGGPQGCSLSGNQFPAFDSLLSTIVKTEIDFGTGVTFTHDTISITRSGKIIVERSGDPSSLTEVTSFENYFVNGIQIEGVKTRVSSYNENTGIGSSITSVQNGKMTFTDDQTATWISSRSRQSEITPDTSGRPASGTITTEVESVVTANDGSIIYSHKTTTPITENVACERRQEPVSGVVETIYRDNILSISFGDGTCANETIAITFNGVTTSQTIGD
jgi:hypothetical protein